MTKLLIGLVLMATSITGAQATDFGVLGNTWPIIEQDIRAMMVESAARTDWSDTKDAVKASAETYAARLPKRKLPVADRTQTVWMDPSIEIKSDIQAPVTQTSGALAWQTLLPKGTRVNPLATVHPVTAMFLFDGSDPDQLKLVQQVLSREPNRIVPVEAGAGDLKKSTEALQRAVFYASDAMVERFNVKYLPTLIYAGTDEHRLYMGLSSFAAPYVATDVLMSWTDLNYKANVPETGSDAK